MPLEGGGAPSAGEGRLALHVLASGSRGNCALVENAATGEGVLIDCGISKKAFLAGCEAAGFDVRRLRAILVTHEHSDHVKGLGVVLRGLAKLGVEPTLYVDEAVRRASAPVQEVQDACALEALTGEALSLAGMEVVPFSTSHDAASSCGFRFECAGDALGFMTDTGTVTGEAHEALRGVRILGLEANHDPDLLRNGPYPAAVKRRIASDAGHLSNEQAACELAALLDDRLEQVVALHVSQNNNDYRLPAAALSRVLGEAGHPARVSVGYQARPVSVR